MTKPTNSKRRAVSGAGKKLGAVRIIAGRWRGRKLPVLDLEGLRPTPDRIRETVFNWLMHDCEGANCLDMCAGSGAMGFEALSRGARSLVMVDRNRQVCQMLEQNIELLSKSDADQIAPNAQVVCQDALAYVQSPTMPQTTPQFDLVFIDPPYALDNHQALMYALEQSGGLIDNALIYAEFPTVKTGDIEPPENWQVLKCKKMGNVCFSLYLRTS